MSSDQNISAATPTVRKATIQDVPEMASVDLLSFFPTCVTYRMLFPLVPGTTLNDPINLQTAQKYMTAEIRAGQVDWIVVEHAGKIISIGKWEFPITHHDSASQSTQEGDESSMYPAHIDTSRVEKFFEDLHSNRDAFYGPHSSPKHTPYAVMQWICTLPSASRLGAARLILEWGLRKCDEMGVHAWIEATQMGAVLYRRFGWKEAMEMHVQSLDGMESEVLILMDRPPQLVS